MKTTTMAIPMAFERFPRLLWVLCCIAGCSTGPGTSGETQFQCSATPDCTKHGPDLVCVEQRCLAAEEPFVNVFVETIAYPNGCLPREIGADPVTGDLHCTLMEVKPGSTEVCDPSRGRHAPKAAFRTGIENRLRAEQQCDTPGKPSCSSFRSCVLQEASESCHRAGPSVEVGWCYIDPRNNPSDDPALVADCRENERRRFNFVDPEQQTPEPGTWLMLAGWGSWMGSPIQGR